MTTMELDIKIRRVAAGVIYDPYRLFGYGSYRWIEFKKHDEIAFER